MRLLILSLFVIPSISFAAPKTDNCKKMLNYKIAITIHKSNFLNAKTTRTPEGGAYKKMELQCKRDCEVIKSDKVLLKYEPKHPDANKEGYVEYPNINVAEERAAISTYAKAIKGLAKQCTDAEVSIDNGRYSFVVEYEKGPIKSDLFNFDDQSKVASWLRERKDGKTQIVNF